MRFLTLLLTAMIICMGCQSEKEKERKKQDERNKIHEMTNKAIPKMFGVWKKKEPFDEQSSLSRWNCLTIFKHDPTDYGNGSLDIKDGSGYTFRGSAGSEDGKKIQWQPLSNEFMYQLFLFYSIDSPVYLNIFGKNGDVISRGTYIKSNSCN